jgi:hypothetical protein
LHLGLKEAGLLQKLIGADVDKARKVKSGDRRRHGAQRRHLATTAPSQGSAAVDHRRPTGITSDFKTSRSTAQNVMRLLDKDTRPAPGATPANSTACLPNGLFGFWLQNGKDGNRQDVVRRTSSRSDQRHRPATTGTGATSAWRASSCHVEGIRPIDDYARRTLPRAALRLGSRRLPGSSCRLRQLYLSDLQSKVDDDRRVYARALWRLTGLKPAEMAKAYGAAWDWYAERDRAAADVALETGYSPRHVVAALKAAAANAPPLDPVLAQLIADRPIPVRVEHLEEVFSLLMTLLRGYIPAVEVKPE